MTSAASIPWLRNARFDLTFIVGITLLGVFSASLVLVKPELFWPVLLADLWLLGYHHLISTFTRLTFDRESFKEHRFLIIGLPIIVAIAATTITLQVGVWLMTSIYLYWQWFHYTRQSEGISKAYRGKARNLFTGDQNTTRAVFWLVPLAGIATVSARKPYTFLTVEVKVIPVPQWLATALVVLASIAFLFWLVQHVRAALRGELALPYFLYMCSHFIIYAVAYILVEDISVGWLAINIWHNAQYILFVWMYNNRRFGGAVDPKHVLLSTISQANRFVMYIALCLAISTFVYYLTSNYLVSAISTVSGVTYTAVAVIFYQTLNFHHYIVDSRIWKLRKKPIRQNLGIQ